MRLYLFDKLWLYRDRLTPLLQPGEQPLALSPFSLARGADHVVLTREDLERAAGILPAGLRKRYADWDYRVRAMRRGEVAPPPPEPVTAVRVLTGILLLPIYPILAVLSGPDTEKWNQRIWGVAAAGATGSCAYQIHQRVGVSSEFLLMVTTSRLLVVKDGGGDLAVEVAIPRQEIRAAYRRGRPLQHGRVVIEFADGSHYAAVTGRFDTARANKIVRALTLQGG
jgi:hypothetical protein